MGYSYVCNANPDSMKASLAILRDLGGNRKIAVLGDMLEMGEYAEEEHRAIGTTVVDYQIDFLITQGSKSRWIAEQASQEGMSSSRIFHFYDNQSVNSYLKKVVYEGDTVLVKGSRGMKMEEIVSYLTNLKDE
jgi:UDP-N-acetylmuramoyl-tripeptide--D-alanyl-D-alanine ligase